MIIQGATETAAAFRRAAATVDLRTRGDFENVTQKVAESYRTGVGRTSGRTAAGVRREVRQTSDGLEGEVYNDHFVSGFHEYGGARSAPNPALQQAIAEHVPSWIETVSRRVGDV